jgi:hypothetical protein
VIRIDFVGLRNEFLSLFCNDIISFVFHELSAGGEIYENFFCEIDIMRAGEERLNEGNHKSSMFVIKASEGRQLVTAKFLGIFKCVTTHHSDIIHNALTRCG